MQVEDLGRPTGTVFACGQQGIGSEVSRWRRLALAVLAASLGGTDAATAVTVSYQLDIIDPELVGYEAPEVGQRRSSDVSVIVTFSSVPDNSCITPADDDGTTDIHVSGGYLVETETEIQPSRMETTAPAQPTAPLRPNSDLLTNIEGVWGWRADFLESCAENPQTIQVAPDRRTLTMRYAKPYKEGAETITSVTFDVVSAEPNKLVLLRTDPAAFVVGKPTPVDVTFADANTMSWSPSNSTMASGAIERCAPAHP